MEFDLPFVGEDGFVSRQVRDDVSKTCVPSERLVYSWERVQGASAEESRRHSVVGVSRNGSAVIPRPSSAFSLKTAVVEAVVFSGLAVSSATGVLFITRISLLTALVSPAPFFAVTIQATKFSFSASEVSNVDVFAPTIGANVAWASIGSFSHR